MINPTNRTVQIARAIDRLSARDMQIFISYILPTAIASEKFRLIENVLKFSDEVFSADYIDSSKGEL